MDFLIATHNMKKRAELERILKPIGVRVLLAEEAGVELTDVEETGVTFEENAFLKADSGCKESGMPCIADDSGLAVDALDGAPGVYSARYAGEHGNDEKNNELLLENLSDVPADEAHRALRLDCLLLFSRRQAHDRARRVRGQNRLRAQRRGRLRLRPAVFAR